MTKVKDLLKSEAVLKDDKLVKPLLTTPIKIGDETSFILLDYPVNEVVHGFILVEIYGTQVEIAKGPIENKGKILYKYEEDGMLEGITELYDADVYLEGSVKWDGCSNWLFNQGEHGNHMLHFCGVEEAALIGEIMRTAYKIASDNIDGFEG